MKFEPGKTYRHRNCLDVDMLVLGSSGGQAFAPGPGSALVVLWTLQRGPGILGHDEVYVHARDYNNWQEV